jgi:hypothetical protein
MRDYYRKVLLDRWDDLLDLSSVARILYLYLMTGPQSSAPCISIVHLGRARRDLGLKVRQMQAAIIELVEAGCIVYSELSPHRAVIADVVAARVVCPRLANHRRSWANLADHVPACDARSAWEAELPFSVTELPQLTGSAGRSIDHASAIEKGNGNGKGNQKDQAQVASLPVTEDKPSKPKRTRKAKPQPDTPPTLEEATAYLCDEWKGKATPAEAEEAWVYWQGEKWHSKRGPVMDWKATLWRAVNNQRKWARERTTDDNRPAKGYGSKPENSGGAWRMD